MSTINTTPRRPSTAQTPSHSTRMSYEAGEALLWERQNARVHTHLSQQMKALQSQHDAYESRITAAEAIAEAAEAAVHQVKLMETKIKAIEEEERDRPFDNWAKEAIGQLQVAVDGLKGVRQKLSALEMKIERLGEDVDGVKEEKGLLESVVRRLELLEDERKVREVERRQAGRQPDCVNKDVHEQTYDKVMSDDNPLSVFYGIDAQSVSRRQESSPRQKDRVDDNVYAYRQDCSATGLIQSPCRHDELSRDLLPPDQDTALPKENVFDPQVASREVDYGWENTQQYKDMQKELAELRAMCRTQEWKGSNDTADATQRPQETIIVPRENNMGSYASSETEVEYSDSHRRQVRTRPSRSSVDMTSSDIHLSSSPPKRTETQSARRNLMKRPSIYDPRKRPIDEYRQDARAEPGNNMISAKRKRIEDTNTERVTRPKLSDDTSVSRVSAASMARKTIVNEEKMSVEHSPRVSRNNGPVPPSPNYGKQKLAVNLPVQLEGPQVGSNWPEHALPAAKPAVSVDKTRESRKAINKHKLAIKKPAQQSTPAQAAPCSPKIPLAVKKEAKAPRQPAGACKMCRTRHQKCDREHPTCGRCATVGFACDYPLTSTSAMPASADIATTSKKQKSILPIRKAADEANSKQVLRGRSATISPEAPRQRSPAKQSTHASKKHTVAAAPTAASSRVLRAKNTLTLGVSQQKEKHK